MKKYEKWRELNIDPKDIKFKTIKVLKEISYPHCGNDVVECEIKTENEQLINAFIKIERSTRAEFQVEIDHLKLLKKYSYLKIPEVIEYGEILNKKYIVLKKVIGSRLSDILLVKKDKKEKEMYLYKYGQKLALIHNISTSGFKEARQRPINDYPNIDKYGSFDSNILPYIEYLINQKLEKKFDTFIHGDFHYANIIWDKEEISGVLDWEYSGIGFKEQDIAWALILRSTQKFMDTIEDINNFLNGYKTIGSYNEEKLKWCLVNGYCHFYLMNKDNEEYKNKLIDLLKAINK